MAENFICMQCGEDREEDRIRICMGKTEIGLCSECFESIAGRTWEKFIECIGLESWLGCEFYKNDIPNFKGCPALDGGGDGDECGNCKYRLENIRRVMCGGV